MKRIGGLFEAIGTRENLGHALWAAARGKRDRPEVAAFLADAERKMAEMGGDLRSGTYRFSPYRSFEVRDTKRRTIHAPAFRDRVAHHAMMRILGPVLERGACEHSFACRRGYGQHRAIERAADWTRRGRWYGKMDVTKFYDSIDHARLMERLERRFRERHCLALFDSLLESYATAPGRGLPIGALTSQYLGNFFLDGLDRDLTRLPGTAHYLRYMDDSVAWARGRDDLAAIRERAGESLAALGLCLKHGGEWNRCEQGVPFLGFVIYPDRVRLGKSGRKRLRAKFASLSRTYRRGEIAERDAQDRATALFAHATRGDDLAWRREILRWHDFGEEPGSRPCPAGRRLEQHRDELPCGVPQQERARQPRQEQRLPLGGGPRIGGADRSPDGAPSHACPPTGGWAESTGKPPPRSDTRRGASRKARGGAPTDGEEGGSDA